MNLSLTGLIAAIVSPGLPELWSSPELTTNDCQGGRIEADSCARKVLVVQPQVLQPRSILKPLSRPKDTLPLSERLAKLVLSMEQIKAVVVETYARRDAKTPQFLPAGLRAAIHKVRKSSAAPLPTLVIRLTWRQSVVRSGGGQVTQPVACADGVVGDLHQRLELRNCDRGKEYDSSSTRDHDTVCCSLKDKVLTRGLHSLAKTVHSQLCLNIPFDLGDAEIVVRMCGRLAQKEKEGFARELLHVRTAWSKKLTDDLALTDILSDVLEPRHDDPGRCHNRIRFSSSC